MDTNEDELSRQLSAFAARYLGRSLTTDELQKLALLRELLAAAQAPDAPVAAAAAQARAAAAGTIDANLQRAHAAMQGALKAAGPPPVPLTSPQPQPPTAALTAEDEAILKVVEGARTLAELRPSALRMAASGGAPAGQMVIAQIADRLANLVTSEVERCFEQRFGPLARQLEEAIRAAASPSPGGAPDHTQ